MPKIKLFIYFILTFVQFSFSQLVFVQFSDIDNYIQNHNFVEVAATKKFQKGNSSALKKETKTEFENSVNFEWVDISSYITDYHTKLGFIDLVFTLKMSVHPDITNINDARYRWSLSRDREEWASQDIRAMMRGIVYETTDNLFKWKSDNVKIWGHNNYLADQKSGSWTVIRFFIPEKIEGPYKIFNDNLSVDDECIATAIQAFIYTPAISPDILKTLIIPTIDVIEPANIQRYQPYYSRKGAENKILEPESANYLSVEQPAKFSADRSFFGNNISQTEREMAVYTWNMGDGTIESIQGTTEYVHIYDRPGEYKVQLTIAAGGRTNVNNGTTGILKNVNSYINYSPPALEFSISVLGSPPVEKVTSCFPSPFVPIEHSYLTVYFDVKQSTSLDVVVKNIYGSKIKNLFNGNVMAGQYNQKWDGTMQNGEPVGNGIYYIVFTTEDNVYQEKVLVVQ